MILSARVEQEQTGRRLDDGSRLLFPSLSKTQIRRIIDWGGCSVNGVMVRVASRILRPGDEIALGIMEPEGYTEFGYTQQELLYEDADYIAINKAAGLNSQRTPYQLKGTVEHAVGTYLKSIGIDTPVMIVHRLDRPTSGVMIFPKTKMGAAHISTLLKEGKVEKRYWALVAGCPPETWQVDAPIAKTGKGEYGVATPGKDALTDFISFCKGEGATLVEARPRTGRTHQIRVHLAHAAFPIFGDRTYRGPVAQRMMLHCRSMSFISRSGKQIEVTAPVDDIFRSTCAPFGIAVE